MVEKRKIGVLLDSKNQIFAQYIEWLRHDHYISERADVTFYKEFPLLLKEKNSIILVDIFCSEYASNLSVTFPAEVVIVLYPPNHKIQTINSWHKNIFVPSLNHLFTIKSILSYVLTVKKTPTSLLPISMGGDIPILNHGDIMYIKTDKSHTCIYTKFKKYLLRQSMSKTLSNMTGTEFVRIHRQYAVNREAITKINFQKMKVEVADAVLPIGPVYKSGLKGLSWG